MDEYSQEYKSDIDTKSIIVPSLDDIVNAAAPISTVIVCDNDEHMEIKDIRIMFDMFKKMNLSYIELLYSDYIIINPKWKSFIIDIFNNRDLIASFNKNQFLKCIAGMAYEKRKALCHPYPSIIDKIEKYGFDGKQLSHCARLYDFISRYTNDEPISACFKIKDKETRMKLMNYKKVRDLDERTLTVTSAIALCDFYKDEVERIKNENLLPHDEINEEVVDFLNKIKYNVIKEKLRREIEEEK